ncbi:P-loop containing nucleoside triphosphate hydrolase protein [Spinellus fusiger]|nr:P-loop containing nucleoside triphosphate hydrolase protein [Spinellus fusiger]
MEAGTDTDTEDEEESTGPSDIESESSQAVNGSTLDSTRAMQVADCGNIARVEVINFMCHKHLKVDLGPKINFVIGHNGSGKSAILTALTIALGAKATSTNRGKKLNSLIREGANAALVIIHLTNQGPDAFKANIYGDTIQIERKLTKEGPGSYKLKNSAGKIISSKREELTAICDHMSIQVDNPLTVLSQDNARQFLNSSTPEDKYKLFMKGTQLSQLWDDYNIVGESIDVAKLSIDRKMQHLPDLYKKAKEAEDRYKEMLEVREIDGKIDELNNELVWAQIIEKEKVTEKARQNAQELESQVATLNERTTTVKNNIVSVEKDIQDMRTAIDGFRHSNVPNREERRRLTGEIVDQEGRLRELGTDLREINDNVKQARARIQRFNKDIAAESAKVEQTNKPKKEANSRKLQQLESTLAEKVKKKESFMEEEKNLEEQLLQVKKDYRPLDSKIRTLEREHENIRFRYKNLMAQKTDKLKAFGFNMPEIVNDIKREPRWKGRAPVGPFGAYIQLKHPEYANVLEIVLGKILNSFVVENFDDRNILHKILSRHNITRARTPIYVARYDIFDYSREEPNEKYLTILRAIKFEDEWVKRQMIIANHIEKILLMSNREEAEQIMLKTPANIRGCFTQQCQSIGAKQGMRTESLTQYRGQPRFKKDIDPEIEEAKQSIRDTSEQLREMKSQQEQLGNRIYNLEKELMDNKTAGYKNDRDISKLNHDIQSLKEEDVDEGPQTLQAYESEKMNCEQQVKLWVGQFAALQKTEKDIQATITSLNQKLKEMNDSENESTRSLYRLQEELQNMDAIKQKERTILRSLEDQFEQRKDRLNVCKKEVKDLERTCKDWISQAMEDYPNRVETTETHQALQRKIDHLDEIRRRKEEEVGITLEEVEVEAKITLTAWHEAKTSIKELEELIKNMKKALKVRLDRWDAFRMYISLSAMGHFTYYMHKRGDSGKLKFDHKASQLIIRVSTGDQFRKGATRQKDSKSLSGGEKSFSQISLLLALWQGISSPVLCLDEFDVYMDAVNRKQAMKMIIDSASDNNSQYILITPQDATNMTPGSFVTVHRLADPERSDE